jgi:nucleotide-binding universal stress UspA family protein
MSVSSQRGGGEAQAGRSIVIGCDRSSSATLAAEWAARQLAGAGTLVLVHACRPLMMPPPALSTPEERLEVGHAVVDELLMSAGPCLLDVDVKVEVLDEDPVSAILGAVRDHEAEAIVIGCEHRSRIRTAIGTVTEELLKSATVPVVAVPQPAGEPMGARG